MQFLKVPEKVFELSLKPSEFKLYLFLVSCQNHLGTATVRIDTIRRKCAIGSAATVRTALAGLERKGVVACSRRYGMDGHCISSKFTIEQYGGKWFKLWLTESTFRLDKSAFAVYAYLCSQRVTYSGKACPSQNTIAAAVGMARHTVNEAIKRLADVGAVIKAAFWKGKHNLYTVMQEWCGEIKKGTPRHSFAQTNERNSKGSKPISRLLLLLLVVKSLILNFTCAIFDWQYLDLTFNPKKIKIKEKLQYSRMRKQ